MVSMVFIEAVKVELRCPFSMKYLGFHSVLGIASFQIHLNGLQVELQEGGSKGKEQR